MLGIKDTAMKSNALRNPFDVPRHALLDQIVRMRANFLLPNSGIGGHFSKLVDEDQVGVVMDL